jgi:hypothetical protein
MQKNAKKIIFGGSLSPTTPHIKGGATWCSENTRFVHENNRTHTQQKEKSILSNLVLLLAFLLRFHFNFNVIYF